MEKVKQGKEEGEVTRHLIGCSGTNRPQEGTLTVGKAGTLRERSRISAGMGELRQLEWPGGRE